MVYRVAELRVGKLILVRTRVNQDWFKHKFWSKDVTIINWCIVIFTFRVFWWRWRVRTWRSVSLGSDELAYPLVLDYFVPRSNSINLRFTTFHWCFVTEEVIVHSLALTSLVTLPKSSVLEPLGKLLVALHRWAAGTVLSSKIVALTHTSWPTRISSMVSKWGSLNLLCVHFWGVFQQTPPLPAHNCDIYDESKQVLLKNGSFWLVKNDVKITYHLWYLYL